MCKYPLLEISLFAYVDISLNRRYLCRILNTKAEALKRSYYRNVQFLQKYELKYVLLNYKQLLNGYIKYNYSA